MVDKIDASFAFGIGGIVTFLQRSLDWSLENPIFSVTIYCIIKFLHDKGVVYGL